MQRHTKPSNENVIEDDNFIRSRLRDELGTGRSAISLRKVVSEALHRPKEGLCDI
jgi:hypothetical protein